MATISKAPRLPKKFNRGEEFNSWRKENDYPRIIEYLREDLAYFKDWMDEFHISVEDMIQLSPGPFLCPNNFSIYRNESTPDQIEKLFLPDYIIDRRTPKEMFHRMMTNPQKGTKELKTEPVLSFTNWRENVDPTLSQKSLFNGGSIVRDASIVDGSFIKNIQLIDLKNHFKDAHIDNDFNLDFCDLRGCSFVSGVISRIWFSDLRSVQFSGHISFMNFHHCQFGEDPNRDFPNFINGSFQSWTISDSKFVFAAKDCRFENLTLKDTIFDGNFDNIELFDVNSSFLKACTRDQSITSYRILKKLCFESYDFESASKLHIKEKDTIKYKHKETIIELSKSYKTKNISFEIIAIFIDIIKLLLSSKSRHKTRARLCLKKYISLHLQSLIWRYGEKPSRVFSLAFLLVIIIFPSLYFFFGPNGDHGTQYSIENSIYFSIITFTTTGYGDIFPVSLVSKVIAGTESLIGIVLMTLAISSFISKTTK